MGQMKYYRGSKDISGTRRTVREWNWYYDESPAVRAMKKLAMFMGGLVAIGAISLVLLGGFAQEADGRDVEPEWTWKVHPSDTTNKEAMNRIWSSRIDEFVNGIIEDCERQKAEEEAAAQAAAYEETWYEPVYYDYSYSGYSGGVSGDPNGLNSFIGRVDWNGQHETAYSSNVLYHYRTSEWTPDEYGFYRTSDGYYVVASNDYEEGTVIETSRGEAMVLDGGCAEGWVDFYTNW